MSDIFDLNLYPFFVQNTGCIREIASPLTTSLTDRVEEAARIFVASLNPDALKKFNGRLERGLEMAQNGAVTPIADPTNSQRFKVRSSDGSHFYWVNLAARTCDCPDSLKGHVCKHRIAAYYVEQATRLHPPVPKASFIKPTCSVMPNTPQVIKPTCTIPPTRHEFSQSELKAKAAAAKAAITTEQGMSNHKVGPEPNSVKEDSLPTQRLGTLFHRDLQVTDLTAPIQVTILSLAMDEDPPVPNSKHWVLRVSGLPEGLSEAIILSANLEEDLIVIFGKVSIEELKGKPIVVYSKILYMDGKESPSIRFRRA